MVCYGTASETRTEPENGQPSLSAAAATSEVKKKTLHNFQVVCTTVAESSHMIRDCGEECKNSILIGLPLNYNLDTVSLNACSFSFFRTPR